MTLTHYILISGIAGIIAGIGFIVWQFRKWVNRMAEETELDGAK